MRPWILTIGLCLAAATTAVGLVGCGGSSNPAPTTGPDAPKAPGETKPGP